MRTTGEILRKRRENLGITAEKLGEMTEVSQAYVTMSENNTTKPSKAYLEKLKKILHITESEEIEIKEYEEFRRLPEKYQKKLLQLDKESTLKFSDVEKKFGEILKEIRLANGDTLQSLAEKSSIVFTYIDKMEKGLRPINKNNLEKLIKVYPLYKKKLEKAYLNEVLPDILKNDSFILKKE